MRQLPSVVMWCVRGERGFAPGAVLGPHTAARAEWHSPKPCSHSRHCKNNMLLSEEYSEEYIYFSGSCINYVAGRDGEQKVALKGTKLLCSGTKSRIYEGDPFSLSGA